MKVNQKNLAGVIEIKDVHQLPTGFKAKYMAWAKVASIFNKECPGWSHHCRLNPQDGHPLFDAPNGSLYFIFYFKDPEGNEYSDFIFPIMGNNKRALKRELVDAREISDTQRRGFVAHCAYQFSLGYELWAKEELDDNEPHLKVVPKTTPKPEPIKKVKYDKGNLVDMIMNELNVKMTNDEQKKLWVIAKAKEYKIEGGGSKLQQMTVLQLRNCLQELENGKF
jgi:hypothetical protein|tara:strand:- start:342 stop:1010 length:669 start_codon:yes stop_codon:yes gene_type:complete